MRWGKQQGFQEVTRLVYAPGMLRRARWRLVRFLSLLWLGVGAYNYLVVFDVMFPTPLRRFYVAFGFGLLGPAVPQLVLQYHVRTPLIEVAARVTLAVLLLFFASLLSRGDAQTRIDDQARRHAASQGRDPPDQLARRLAMGKTGLPLACVHGRVVGLPYGADCGHVIVVAPTRSGKGLHLTEALLRWSGAAVVIDPKGEQWERTAAWRTQQIGPVWCIPSAGIDVCAYFDLRDPLDMREVHQHLLRPWLDNEKIFGEKSLALVQAAVDVAAATGDHPLSVLACWTQMPAHVALTAAHPYARAAIDLFTDGDDPRKPNRFALSAWGTFTARLLPLAPHIARLTRPLIPRDWAARKAMLYLCYPLDQLEIAGPLISTLLAALIKGQLKQRGRQSVLLAMDELPAVGLYNLPTYLATIDGAGLTALIYAQALPQLEEVYGKAKAQAILANCHHQLFYPPRDNDTALLISRALGTTITPAQATTRGRQGISDKTQAEQRSALEPAQVLALPEQAVVLMTTLAGRQYRVLAERLDPRTRLRKLPAPPAVPPPVISTRHPTISRLPVATIADAALAGRSDTIHTRQTERLATVSVNVAIPTSAMHQRKRGRLEGTYGEQRDQHAFEQDEAVRQAKGAAPTWFGPARRRNP
jgi:hypothetical protein